MKTIETPAIEPYISKVAGLSHVMLIKKDHRRGCPSESYEISHIGLFIEHLWTVTSN